MILIILGYIISTKLETYSKQQLNIIFYSPYVILSITAMMAWRFNRSRTFFISILFISCLFTLFHYTKWEGFMADIFLYLCILLPLNIIVFTFLKERGIISIWGMFRFSFILLQAGAIYWIITTNQKEIYTQINKPLFPFASSSIFAISQIAVLLFLLSFFILIVRFFLYQSSQDLSFVFVLIVLYYVLNVNEPIIYALFFTVIGSILILTMLQDTYFMAFYDELTGLPSRRALNQDLMKLGLKYSIAMLDIDHFKKFNDTYGHDTGDEVLKFIASIIKDVKGSGKAYRYGGEEFTILFPGKNTDDVLSTLEELRETIAKKAFVLRPKRKPNNSKNRSKNKKKRGTNNTSKKIYIHVSIGVSNKDENLKTTGMVIKAADTALYRAKKKGRNCVSK